MIITVLFLIAIPFVTAENTAELLTQQAVNASGAQSAIGDFSAGVPFTIQPPVDEVWYVHRLLVHYEDSGSMDTEKYGNGIVLTNGITIYANQSGRIVNLTNGHPILTNGEWAAHSYDTRLDKFGAGNEFISVRWSFFKTGTVIKLDGAQSDSLTVLLQDDFSGLEDQFFLFQGYKGPNTEDSMLSIIIGLLFTSVILIVIGSLLSQSHKIYQVLLTFFAMLILYLLSGYLITVTNNVATLGLVKIMNWLALITGIYFFIYLIWEGGKKSETVLRWMGKV